MTTQEVMTQDVTAHGIGWVDLAMLGFMALSVLAGLVRGVVFELMSLAGWFVAYFAAVTFEPWLLPYVRVAPPGSALNSWVAVVAVFVAALVVWGLLARLLRSVVRATPLSVPDRLLGAGFGALRGVMVLTLAAMVVGVTPLARAPAWQRSQGAVLLAHAAREIGPWLPFRLIQPPSQGESYVRHRRRDLQEPRQPVDL